MSRYLAWKLAIQQFKIQLTIIDVVGRVCNARIGETPSCTYEYQNNLRKIKHRCKYIVRVLLDKSGIHPSNTILAQVSSTISEINVIFNSFMNELITNATKVYLVSHDVQNQISIFKDCEIQAVFETKSEGPQKWYADNLLTKCCTCSNTIPAQKLYVFVSELYIPPGQHFAKDHTFYFHAFMKCLDKKPYMNNLQVPPIITVDTRNSRRKQY